MLCSSATVLTLSPVKPPGGSNAVTLPCRQGSCPSDACSLHTLKVIIEA